jgi:hypothetical protein
MNEDKICQATDCNNIGQKVQAVIAFDDDKPDEIHTIWFCQMHQSLTSARKGFTN